MRGRKARASFTRFVGLYSTLIGSLLLSSNVMASIASLKRPQEPEKIYGGEQAPTCAWPTSISIESNGDFCDGVILHPQVVVYPAECGEADLVYFGETHDDNGPEIETARCHVHSGWEAGYSGTNVAFCVLSEPATDIPIVPPMMGCEAESIVHVGSSITLAGTGFEEGDEHVSKRITRSSIKMIHPSSDLLIGGAETDSCTYRLGVPAFAQLDDGSWRVVGLSSWGLSESEDCTEGVFYNRIDSVMEWLEEKSGFDLTPCHTGDGQWDPGPDCTNLPLSQGKGEWKNFCDEGARSGPSESCGPAFSAIEGDTEGPQIFFEKPNIRPGSTVQLGGESAKVPLRVGLDDHEGSGGKEVTLRILNEEGVEELLLSDDLAPFDFGELNFTSGAWTLKIEASDRAGNESVAWIGLGVGTEAPLLSEEAIEESRENSDSGSKSLCQSSSPSALAFPLYVLFYWRRRRFRALAHSLPFTLVVLTSLLTACDGEGPAAAETNENGPQLEQVEPGCGNGIVEDDEQCDDGNDLSGDGCTKCRHSGSEISHSDFRDVFYFQNTQEAQDGSFWVSGRVNRDGEFRGWLGLFDTEGNLQKEVLPEAQLAESSYFRDFVRLPDGSFIAVGGSWPADELIATLWKLGPNAAVIEKIRGDPSRISRWFGLATNQKNELFLLGRSEDSAGDEAATTQTLEKFDLNLNPLWQVQSSSLLSIDRYSPLEADQDGNLVTTDFLEGEEAERRYHVQKRSSENGELLWSTALQYPHSRFYPDAIAVSSSGTIAVAGSVSHTGQQGMPCIVFLSANGAITHFQVIEGFPAGDLNQIYSSAENEFYFLGRSNQTTSSRIAGKIYIDGTVLWTNSFGATVHTSFDHNLGFIILSNGRHYVLGEREDLNVEGYYATLTELVP